MTECSLKPCPFCGGEAEIWQEFDQLWRPMCTQCDVMIALCYKSAEDAARTWNTRAKEDKP
jgi:hypothetical protein